MPPRAWRLRIEDMLDAIRAIEEFVEGLDFEAFWKQPIKRPPRGTRQRCPRASRKARMRKLHTLPAKWWNVTGWKRRCQDASSSDASTSSGTSMGTNQSAGYR